MLLSDILNKSVQKMKSRIYFHHFITFGSSIIILKIVMIRQFKK
jgi:hypothetical protein